MSAFWLSFAAVLASYMVGSVPFSYLLVRFRTGADLRTTGTRNVGAYNVFKQMGPSASVLATLLDIGKGMVGFKMAGWLGAPHGAVYLCVAAVVAGHVYSIFLRFKGGTGVATGLGAVGVATPLNAVASFVGGVLVGLPLRSPPVGTFAGLILLNVLVWATRQDYADKMVALLVTLAIISVHLLKKYRQVRSGLKKASWKEIF